MRGVLRRRVVMVDERMRSDIFCDLGTVGYCYVWSIWKEGMGRRRAEMLYHGSSHVIICY